MRPTRTLGAPLLVLALLGALAPQDSAATIYGLKSCGSSGTLCGSVASAPPVRLFSFAEDGTAFTDIGTVAVGGNAIDADALALSLSGALFAYELTATGSTLLSLDASTGAATRIGAELGSRDMRGAAFGNAGQLLAVDVAADELVSVNTADGSVTGTVALQLAGNPFDVVTGNDIALRRDGTLVMVNDNAIYALDPLTGVLDLLFTETATEPSSSATPFYAGAAFSQDAPDFDLYAYEVNGQEDVYRYAGTDSGYARAALVTNLIPTFNGQPYNAGRGDLAAAMAIVRVPEPPSVLLLAVAALGLALWYRAPCRTDRPRRSPHAPS